MEVLAKVPSAEHRDGDLKLVLKALSAFRRGEHGVTLPTEWDGLYGKIAAEFNELSSQTSRTSHKLKTVAAAPNTGARTVKRVADDKLTGFWQENVASVNSLLDEVELASDRTRTLLSSLTELKKGSADAHLPHDWTGLFGKVADAFNDVVAENVRMSQELARLSRVVGKEGKLKERAAMPSQGGFWRDSAESINSLISDLVHPTSEVARVIGAVAQGDLSKSMALEADGRALEGEFLRTAMTINKMVQQLGTFSAEVTRVAREVGTEGKLGGQAEVQGVAGTWKDLTDSVNSMAGNLTAQVRNIAEVTKAVAAGDLSKKITVDVKGEILELKNTINTMVDQLRSFASEVTRVAREVGTEGKLGGQADVQGVAGTWKDLTESVNFMAGNLTSQVRNIADVTKAVAAGDLSKKITVDVKGEILELKNTINTMVDQLRSFASEVTRVAREVGTEGKLGGQADVQGVAGTWKDLTDSVNSMAGNLTAQVRNIADVTKAVAAGDLSKKITVDVKGEILELKNTINTMVDQLRSFASEVTRVAREVGTEGKLGGQADVQGVAGTWKDLTDSVNSMAGNLTAQVRNIAEVTTAVAAGDLSKKITVDVKGEILELKNTINTMVDQLSSFASEVTRVAREVGTEGKLGGQADVQGVAGTWKDLTESVNFMAGNLTSQVRNIADVTKAVAAGDLSKKITVDVKGEILELKNTINTMVDQLSSFASEVTRVAREVGTEGKLGGQADVQGVAGTWKDLTDSVNSMAGNLTAQVRNIADVTKAVAAGDLSKKITVDVKGEILELKNTINTMVDQLRSFASEVTRVAREVGTEGKLGGQADVQGVAGTWKDLTDNVNFMAGNLTAQVRNIADVTKAVAAGDLSKKITVDVKGEILELKNTINTMVDQLRSFASEVTRVAREVGTEGKLGGQADVQGVAGTWKDLTDSVNSMAGNLTAQVRNIAEVTTAVAAGDLSKKITVDVKGEILELKNTINTMVDQLRSFASEVTRVAREVGTEGKLGGQAYVQGVAGTWKDLTDNVNFMAGNLTAQVRNIADVTKAVAAGDLSKKITVDVKGEILELKNTINTMVDQLSSFAAEVTRVAREVGTEGKLGGQAYVQGVAGTWKDLTDNVNFMAGNLTSQVRGIAKVVTAVANGDLDQKLTVEAKGEVAALADTINAMTDTLATFADQVTTVAREVGVEGKLGGQAKVPGASGTWKGLTENVNQLAANLTTQVRAIAEVATAVTQGDLTRSITVEALGEMAALKDTVNEMIRNLRDTTQVNTEQDWLKTNLAKFSRMLQGQRDLVAVGHLILSELAPVVGAQQAEFYVLRYTQEQPKLRLMASYASDGHGAYGKEVDLGQGLVGQAAFDKKKITLTSSIPETLKIASGLTEVAPLNVLVLPIIFEGQVRGVIELASVERFNPTHQAFLDQLTESIGIVINTIEANMRTEDLLAQSQSLAQELQSRQEELQQTNEELQEKARLLAHQNQEVERKNSEVEQARQALEEKAKQLALTSKYKSEFLANMSHELRTPLNSLLILSDQLCKNPEGNLTPKQVEFAKTIHSSGNDLLMLINDILDLSKIESGTVVVDVNELRLSDLQLYVERTFRHVAEAKNVDFTVRTGLNLPASMVTDAKRLQQILKNLLSNAFKFTHQGHVTLTVEEVFAGWAPDNEDLNRAQQVLAFSVSDTGIGISPDKQQIIFEAFQQADGSTSRKYGGTGLGLAISRELSKLLGGEIRLVSAPGQGSTFTLYLPLVYMATRTTRRVTTDYRGDQTVAPVPKRLPTPVPSAAAEVEDAVEVEVEGDELLAADNVANDDRDNIQPSDQVLLIVENDLAFARFLLDAARAKGFKGLVTTMGAGALTLASQHKPSAVTLDMHLPDMAGWRVLDRIKHDLALRHVPVCVISTDDSKDRAFKSGALAFLEKPIRSKEVLDGMLEKLHNYLARTEKSLLVAVEDQSVRNDLLAQIEGEQIDVTVVATAAQLQQALDDGRFDAVVLEDGFAGADTRELRRSLAGQASIGPLPLILYRGDAGARQAWHSDEGITVHEVQGAPKLFDATLIALHRSLARLPEIKRNVIDNVYESAKPLAGKRVLIVDDDMRNIFALATVLEEHGMDIVWADNGREAINRVANDPGIQVVLMDIMMPEMDGMATMKEIRKLPQGRNLPMIAVTAKAMKGDREKCIEAGAWDYLAKPVNTPDLLSVLRAWLQQ
ncbi:hybrid sensor histidine kinase/response regulator [Ramlibacter pallidus]|uniref:hybrid sensor histidine kinase/response regulator n=1 Tax=Ramlibacter pallidus TaxID=2780087 RepID=UPI001D0D2A34|nr:HAMP domain-containing protein [Ramlibacter pallidus]